MAKFFAKLDKVNLADKPNHEVKRLFIEVNGKERPAVNEDVDKYAKEWEEYTKSDTSPLAGVY